MTIQTFARRIVTQVLDTLETHVGAEGIPEPDIRAACAAVAALIREDSATCVEPDAEGA